MQKSTNLMRIHFVKKVTIPITILHVIIYVLLGIDVALFITLIALIVYG